MTTGVIGRSRVTPIATLPSRNGPIEIGARHLIEPYRQDRDRLCGLWSSLNALRLVLYGHAPLTTTKARRLLKVGADYLDEKSVAGQAIWAGIDTRRWHGLIRKLAKHASDEVIVDVERAEFLSKPTIEQIFDWITISIADGKPALIHLAQGMNHFSVVAGVTPTRLLLFDSTGMKFARKSSFGVKSGFYHLPHKALLRLSVRKI